MLDLAAHSAGGRVLLASSVDAGHPGECVLEDDLRSYWLSTGLYPQELLLALGRPSAVQGVQLASTCVRQVRIEGSQEAAPVNFHTLAEAHLENAPGIQLQSLPCRAVGGARTGFVRVVILSGWHDFCSVHRIRVEGEPGPEPAQAPALGAKLREARPAAMRDELIEEVDRGGSSSSSQQLCNVRVRSPGGSSYAIAAGLSWTLQLLKDAVEAAAGVPPREQRLLLGAAELPDTGTLGEASGGADTVDLTVVRRDPLQAKWLEQVKRDGLTLRFAQELAADREVALAAVRHSGDALQFAAEVLRGDKELALEAVRRKGSAIQFAPQVLRLDRDVALTAVSQSGNALQYCGVDLQDDKAVVLAAVTQHGSALRWASAGLRADPEVIEVASRTFFFTREELAAMCEE